MTISDVSIRRPVFAWMIMIGLIVFGAICYRGMGISQLPDVDFPVLNISVTWVGASPDTMESAVADVIEGAVMSVEGIRSVTTKAAEGVSNTTVEFELTRDIDVALQEIQTKIAQASRNLPNTIDPPVVTKQNPEDNPIIWAALTGQQPQREKIIFARDRLRDSMTTVAGVGDVRLGGYVEPNMRIWVDNSKMTKLQLTISDVMKAITTGTILAPTGYIESGLTETNIRVQSEPRTPEEFAQLVIPSRGGANIWSNIQVGDVAKIELGLEDIRRISRFNGEPSIGLGIVKQRGSNAVAVGEGVRKRVEELKSSLPKGMALTAVIDTTKFIEESTHELIFTLFLSAILTSLVCYLFLGSWGIALNVILAIPVALVGSFIFLRWFGFTINTFTLLALSLSIGIVVDDAIMVLENISRYYEQGMSRVRASLVGAREITGAAVATSLAILAIFLPVIFMKGIVGKFFLQFGAAMSVAVVLSLIEALTLAPMRMSTFLTKGKDSKLKIWVDHKMEHLMGFYRWSLEHALSYRWVTIGVATAVFGGSLLLIPSIKKEFIPSQDQGLFNASIYLPVGSSLEATDQVFKKAEELLKSRPEVASFLINVGGFGGSEVNAGNMFVVLKDKKDRPVAAPFKEKATQQDMMAWARENFSKIPGVERAAIRDPSQQGFASGRGFPISFSIQGPDYAQLEKLTNQMMAKMRESKKMVDVDTDFSPNMPEVHVVPDRVAAAKYGITIETIAQTVSALIGGSPVAKYTDATGHRDDIRVKLAESENQSAKDIANIRVRNAYGEVIPLSKVVKLENTKGLQSISRYNRERAITINANPATTSSQQEALDYIQRESKEMLPDGYHIVESGSSQAFRESMTSLWVALALGIFVAYMVLGAQFNSFIHPITILLALPFSFTGAFIALKLSGNSLNMYSMIGMLLLMGIVKKNSILLVDFTNQRRAEGKSVHDALLEACPTRLRPILMTSAATVAAAIPAALALGPGAETTRPMAVVVIGGVTLSTILTLIVIPCAYSLFSNLESHTHEEELKEALDVEDEEASEKYERRHKKAGAGKPAGGGEERKPLPNQRPEPRGHGGGMPEPMTH